MIVVLEHGTSDQQAADVLAELERHGLRGRVIGVLDRPLVHVVEGPTRAARSVLGKECVQGLVPTSGPRIRTRGRRFYPYHFINWSTAALLTLGVLVLLAGFFPPGLGGPIDPQRPIEPVTPWYLRAPEAVLRLFPEGLTWLGGAIVAGATLVLLLLPWIDRGPVDGGQRWPRAVLAFLLAGTWLALTFGGLV